MFIATTATDITPNVSPLTDEPLMGEISASDGFAAKNEPTQNQLGDTLRPQLGVDTWEQNIQPEIDAYSLRKAACHPRRALSEPNNVNKTAITTLWQQPERNRTKNGSTPCTRVWTIPETHRSVTSKRTAKYTTFGSALRLARRKQKQTHYLDRQNTNSSKTMPCRVGGGRYGCLSALHMREM